MRNENEQQIVVIHGGDTFDSYEEYLSFLKDEKEPRFETMMEKDWKDKLQKNLGGEYEVVIPSMPNKQSAQYNEWKIWFEKHFSYLDDGIVLIGHSLGGIFLAKYLSENRYPKNIRATFLVAAPFDMTDMDYSLASFSLANKLDLFPQQSKEIYIYHSKDDPVVPFEDFKKYENKLPKAYKRIFKDKEHFSGELPEIIEDIKNL